MAFFGTKPNLTGNEKARIEFHLQQILDCVGLEPLQIPFIDPQPLLTSGSDLSACTQAFADHLSHDIGQLRIEVVPEQLEKCGGGG
ncbi:MAG: hypothetical protein MK108_03690 [Mariniblastus sp.]|nr:hypothetical protein [Mariniblastus sp.]